MSLDVVLAFLLGALLGFLAAAYVMHRPELEKQLTAHDPEKITQLLHQQVAFAQVQNMLRQLQLEEARQEQELRSLERSRISAQVISERLRFPHAD